MGGAAVFMRSLDPNAPVERRLDPQRPCLSRFSRHAVLVEPTAEVGKPAAAIWHTALGVSLPG
jgi:hypothetical protein